MLARQGHVDRAKRQGADGDGLAWAEEPAVAEIYSHSKEDAVLSDRRVFWADLHNHNEIGYGRGSLARAIEVAREQLDVFCFTPHGQWFDEANTPPEVHRKHQEGFERVRQSWDQVRAQLEAAYVPGSFVTFLGHEWHSSNLGDYHVVYPGPDHRISYFDDIRLLQQYVHQQGAIMVPHHVAYARGSRGIAWEYFDPAVSPVVEIFSEHGSSETEWGPWPMMGHSMGPASTTQTIAHALEQGLVFGFTASTDDHLGYPGAYGEGMTGVLAEELTRESVFEALRSRHTYAVTGDRIGLDFQLDEAPMGSLLPARNDRLLRVTVRLEDEPVAVEMVKNGRVWRRLLCESPIRGPAADAEWVEFVLRVEWGWGGMGSEAVVDWLMRLTVTQGEIVAVTPHFQSGPYDEVRRNRVLERTPTFCAWQSYTSRRQAFRGVATNSLLFTIRARAQAELLLETEKPSARRVRTTVAEAFAANHVERMGSSFSAETLLVHRALPVTDLERTWHLCDREAERERDYYYVRVQQRNGHMAWSSPIWVGG